MASAESVNGRCDRKMTTNDRIMPPLLEFPDPPRVRRAVVEEEQPFVIVEARFPRIAQAIHLMWGHVELEDYLHNLIVADRRGREGFPDAVHAALLKLYNQHASLFKFAARTEDVWSRGPDAKQRLKEDKARQGILR
jgi:hypothetical protein